MPHIDDILGKRAWLMGLRQPIEEDIEDIQELMMPFRGDVNGRSTPGQNRVDGCFDSTAMTASDALTNFVVSNIFPPTGDWLRLQARGGSDPDTQDALDAAGNKLLSAYAASNYYVQMGKFIRDLILLGNAHLYVESKNQINADEPDNLFGGFTFEAVPFGRFARYVDRNGAVLVASRDFTLSAFEVEREFGVSLDTGKFAPIELSHVIEPGNGDRAFDSFFVVTGGAESQILRQGGNDFMPYVSSRLELVDDFQYGYGRGHIARATAAGMNEARRLTLNAMGKDLDPPLVVEDDSVVSTARAEGGIIVKKPDTDPLSFLRSGTDYSVADRIAREDQAEIGRAFMSDLVLDPDTQPRSAEESRQRSIRLANRTAGMGVAIGNGALAPIVELTASIMKRDGGLPELEAGDVGVEFVSPFFSLQRAASVQKVVDFIGLNVQVSNLTQDPSLLDGIDMDAAAQHIAENSDVPAKIFRDVEVRDERRQARAENEAEQQFAEDASKLAAIPQLEANTPGLELS